MFINSTETIGIILGHAAEASIGSLIAALLILLIVFLGFCLMFGIPLEYSAIVILPLLLSYMAYYEEFIVIGGALFIYLSFILTKMWVFK